MQTKYTYKQIWLIAYPILISLLMEQMIGMTDTAFLGRVGEVELGASAIAGVFYMVIFMVAFGFSIGAQILIARRNGERQYKEIGAFFSFSAVMFRAFFLGTTQTKTLTLNSIVMVLSNVVFNYILIFGKFGFPALGIAGAAIGSSLAELVSLLFFILYTRSRIDCRKYGLDRIPKFRLDVLKRMLNVSFWTMIQNFFSLSTWFLFFLYVEHLGERSLAVTNIVRNVSGILFMVLMAFASTCGSLVSNLIGAGHSDCVAGTIRQHVRIAYVFVLPLALLFALFPKLILGIYTDIPDLQDAAVHSLWVMCSTYLFLVPANVYFQAVSGTGNTRTALGMELATLVIYTAYITYIILILQLDVAICWTSEMVYSSFILIFCWLYIKRGNWQGRKI